MTAYDSRLAARHVTLSEEVQQALASATPGRPFAATTLELSPDDSLLAFTGLFRIADGEVRQSACLLDLADNSLATAEGQEHESGLPVWSPDSSALARVSLQEPCRLVVAPRSDPLGPGTARLELPPGSVETLEWSPDGAKLLVRLAEPGASLSDVDGAGRIAGPEVGPGDSWRPWLSPQDDLDPPRRALVVDVASGAVVDAVPDRTVWEVCWAGHDTLFALVSTDADESAWYAADPVLVDLDQTGSSGMTVLPRPADQLAGLCADHGEGRLALIAGLQSDRGLESGDLLVLDRNESTWRRVDTGGVDVSDLTFRSSHALVFAGLRGQRTVIGELDPGAGSLISLWESDQTCGEPVPRCAVGGDSLAVIAHGYTSPPEISTIADGTTTPRWGLGDDQSTALAARIGEMRPVAWTAEDGTTIEGLLALPDGPAPFPLVVQVHGGPVWSLRDGWMTDDQVTPLLVAAGYAVLHPNVRGSTGRGQEFVRQGLLDMCGQADVSDVLAGVEYVVREGWAERGRIVICGLSYGGLMAAWMATATDVFAAAIARSPVTDWVSQHHTSNLAGLDLLCLRDDPLAADSAYRAHSPLYAVTSQLTTPILLVAGAQDLATPPEQASMFYRAMREKGVPAELVIYPEEGHGVHDLRAAVDQGARILDFLERTLPAPPDHDRDS